MLSRWVQIWNPEGGCNIKLVSTYTHLLFRSDVQDARPFLEERPVETLHHPENIEEVNTNPWLPQNLVKEGSGSGGQSVAHHSSSRASSDLELAPPTHIEGLDVCIHLMRKARIWSNSEFVISKEDDAKMKEVLGRWVATGEWDEVRDEKWCVEWYVRQVERGDGEAAAALAHVCIQRGENVKKNPDLTCLERGRQSETVAKLLMCAFALFTMAQEKGMNCGINGLGASYCYGWGVPVDKNKGLMLLGEVFKDGNAGAAAALGKYFESQDGESDEVKAVKYYKLAVEGRNVYAMNKLGISYASGGPGVEKDAVKAVEYYEMAVEGGCAKAMLNVGFLHASGGPGVEKDAVKAVKYYEMAVERGNVVAMNNLGVLYAIGRPGVEKDAMKAVQYYKMAVKRGQVDAMINLGFLYKSGERGVVEGSWVL